MDRLSPIISETVRKNTRDSFEIRAYRFTDDLPWSPIGKLHRGVIRDEFGHPIDDS